MISIEAPVTSKLMQFNRNLEGTGFCVSASQSRNPGKKETTAFQQDFNWLLLFIVWTKARKLLGMMHWLKFSGCLFKTFAKWIRFKLLQISQSLLDFVFISATDGRKAYVNKGQNVWRGKKQTIKKRWRKFFVRIDPLSALPFINHLHSLRLWCRRTQKDEI